MARKQRIPSNKISSIIARGIRVHNLKGIDVEIPLGKLVVVSGVSGSGKSSLVFDTLFAEGQRRYVETFSTYARQFLDRMDKPDVDHIEGIPPAIAIQQKNPVKSRRSTVGTATELNDYLRLLFARIGKTYCKGCGRVVGRSSVEDVVERVLKLERDTRFLVTFPIAVSRKLPNRRQLDIIKEQGLIRLWAQGRLVDLMEEPGFNLRGADSVYGVLDRLVVRPGIKDRLADALETAFRLGAGHLKILLPDSGQEQARELRFSNRFFCDYCRVEYPEPTPGLFSFNNPVGACPGCQGFGNTIELDMDLVVPDKGKTIREGAIQPWSTPAYYHLYEDLENAAPACGIPLDVPFRKLTSKQMKLVMEGTPEFCGIHEFFEWLENKKYKIHVRVLLSKYRGYVTCADCNGARLNPKALSVRINGATIGDICAMTVERARDFFMNVRLNGYEEEVATLIFREIRERLDYMARIGLEYLTLDRLTRSLSGGEAQRVNIATSLGSSLVNVLYILDEPSIGLHPRDTERLITTLKRLRDLGNTIVTVEHDRDVINAADQLIDLGPEAGEKGGRIVFQGTIDSLKRKNGSLTGQYLLGKRAIPIPKSRRRPTGESIVLTGAHQNNLKNVDATFPLGMLVCVTGVSGSGKSTLVEDTLYAALRKKLSGYRGTVGKYRDIAGVDNISDVIMVDQSPIGRTPRSNPITYLKSFDEIRKLFASTREARIRNLTPSAFSFNVAGGRCDNCEGEGYRKVDMQFLADIFVTCEKCRGRRFRRDVLDIRYRHKNIHEVLEMTVEEAKVFFKDLHTIIRTLRCLEDTGLGYLRLGQPATTLSGGEAQRLKLASFLSQKKGENVLFLFDEPTTGLHFDDIRKLLDCFQRLIGEGHSVIVIEHNLDVIKCADYVMDLGPEGGEHGGEIVGAGTPEKIVKLKDSYTGKYLKEYLTK